MGFPWDGAVPLRRGIGYMAFRLYDFRDGIDCHFGSIEVEVCLSNHSGAAGTPCVNEVVLHLAVNPTLSDCHSLQS